MNWIKKSMNYWKMSTDNSLAGNKNYIFKTYLQKFTTMQIKIFLQFVDL